LKNWYIWSPNFWLFVEWVTHLIIKYSFKFWYRFYSFLWTYIKNSWLSFDYILDYLLTIYHVIANHTLFWVISRDRFSLNKYLSLNNYIRMNGLSKIVNNEHCVYSITMNATQCEYLFCLLYSHNNFRSVYSNSLSGKKIYVFG
jgi:hypothetical protein